MHTVDIVCAPVYFHSMFYVRLIHDPNRVQFSYKSQSFYRFYCDIFVYILLYANSRSNEKPYNKQQRILTRHKHTLCNTQTYSHKHAQTNRKYSRIERHVVHRIDFIQYKKRRQNNITKNKEENF